MVNELNLVAFKLACAGIILLFIYRSVILVMKKDKSVPAVPATTDIKRDKNDPLRPLDDLCVQIIQGTGKVAMLYLKVCEFFRLHCDLYAVNKTDAFPKQVLQAVMHSRGFSAPRVSEIWAISQMSPEAWAAYEKRALSFREALKVSRGKLRFNAETNLLEAPEEHGQQSTPEGSSGATEEVSEPAEEAIDPLAERDNRMLKLIAFLCSDEMADDKWDVAKDGPEFDHSIEVGTGAYHFVITWTHKEPKATAKKP